MRKILLIALLLIMTTPAFAVPEEILRCYLVEGVLVCEHTRKPKDRIKGPALGLPGEELRSPLPPTDSRDDFMLSGFMRFIIALRGGLMPWR